jgi:GNAT superfamily N-acetyltransferase
MISAVVCAKELGVAERWEAAGLARESFEEYFDKLDLPEDVLLRILEAEFLEPATELSCTRVALDVEERVVGVVTAFPSAEIVERQQATLFHLLSSIDDDAAERVLQMSGCHRNGVPPAPRGSYYLARFAVTKSRRGSGDAALMFQGFREAARSFATIALHVNRANVRAQAFYSKQGMLPYGPADLEYLCLSATL